MSDKAPSSPASNTTEVAVALWDNVHLCHGAINGDFARLVPSSPMARQLFSQVAAQLETDSDSSTERERFRRAHVQKFMHYETTVVEESDADSFLGAPPSPAPANTRTEYCGYYRLNMGIPPGNLSLGWVLGRSAEGRPVDYVDFQLAPYDNDDGRLHARHCRLQRRLNTGVLVAISDGRKFAVNGKIIQRPKEGDKTANQFHFKHAIQHGSSLRLGDLTYLLVATDQTEEQQERELADARRDQGDSTSSNVMLLSPTPSRRTFDYHGYSLFGSKAHGSTCSVHTGFSSGADPIIAKMVKCTRDSQLQKLREEIRILGLLRQDNVIKLEAVFNLKSDVNPRLWRSDEGLTVGLIMSPPGDASGTSLLGSWKGYPRPTAFLNNTMHQLADGLAYIHSCGVIHHDIKPDNIIFTRTIPVNVIITDFGCSEEKASSTDHGRGTIPYLAPEVMAIKDHNSHEPFSFPSDVWSLGATLLDFLAGQKYNVNLGRPFDFSPVQRRIKQESWDAMYGSFWVRLETLLAWEPGDRPTAMGTICLFPLEAERDQPPEKQSPSTPTDEDGPRKRREV